MVKDELKKLSANTNLITLCSEIIKDVIDSKTASFHIMIEAQQNRKSEINVQMQKLTNQIEKLSTSGLIQKFEERRMNLEQE